MNKKKIILIAVSIAVVAGAGLRLFGSSKAQHKVTYETAVVTREAKYRNLSPPPEQSNR